MTMKKMIVMTALMCQITVGAKAQIYAGDSYMRYPTVDLYDPAIMSMSLRAHAEMAARRAAIFDQYAQWAADAYNEERWNDAIKYASSALSIFDNGQQYFIRGYAYEYLGALKDARKDYKKSKKMGYGDAIAALERVNGKIKAQRKRK